MANKKKNEDVIGLVKFGNPKGSMTGSEGFHSEA